jgi:AraC-like DNA-binding protein
MPIVLVNLMRDVASAEYYLFFMYPAYTLNLLGLPAMWFFAQSQMDKSFRLTRRSLLYTIPAVVSLGAHVIYFAPLTVAEIEADIALMRAGGKILPGIINDAFLNASFIGYAIIILRYVRKRMKYLRDHFSDSGYNDVSWTPRFFYAFFGLMFVTAVGYAIYPRTDTWLIPSVITLGMTYLTYIVIRHSTFAYINRIEASPDPSEGGEQFPPFGGIKGGLSEAHMKEVCDKVMNYLTSTGAYTNPAFSLSMLSVGTNISPTNLSRSIKGYLNKNFFDIINEMRIEEAKKILRSHGDKYKIDGVYADCGFHTRATFYSAFKKIEGKTPTQWLKVISV